MMNIANPNRMATLLLALVTGALIIAGCASNLSMPTPEGPPPSPQDDSANDQAMEVEETVVMGARVERERRFSRSASEYRVENFTGALELGVADPGLSHALSSLSAPGEELWIIDTSSIDAGQTGIDDLSPGTGAMLARFPDDIVPATNSPREIPLPLKHTAVDG